MKTVLLCSILVCLAGCALQRTGTLAVRPLPAANISEEKTDSIRYPGALRAYHLGRYADPNNPLAMHESHTLYRVEQTANWNLRPGSECELLSVGLKTLSDPAHVPAPFNDEIIGELNRQKEITQRVTTEASRITAVLQKLGEALGETKAVAKENVALKVQLSDLERKISALENELRQPKRAIDADSTNASVEPDH